MGKNYERKTVSNTQKISSIFRCQDSGYRDIKHQSKKKAKWIKEICPFSRQDAIPAFPQGDAGLLPSLGLMASPGRSDGWTEPYAAKSYHGRTR